MDSFTQEYIESIKTKEDFTNFLKKLEDDFLHNSEQWANTSLNDYFESIGAWIQDYSLLSLHSNINWGAIALIFYMGKIYE